MLNSEEEWLTVVDAFNAAAVGNSSWLDALAQLAQATGSRAGELIGLGSQQAVPFNWMTDVGPEWMQDFLAVGGADPAVNPNVRTGAQLGELCVKASCDFVTSEEKESSRFVHEFLLPQDMPYICLSPLLKNDGMLVGLAVTRSASQGEISDQQRAIFASLAPHVRSAVKTQMALEHQGSLLVAGALEALAMAVFICDRRGQVRSMTPLAEQLVAAAGPLQLLQGQLVAGTKEETLALQTNIQAAASARAGLVKPSLANSVVVRRKQATPLVLDILPLPRREHAFVFDAQVLVVARGKLQDAGHRKQLLQAAYQLTAAEVDVALLLAEGCTPQQVAELRRTSPGTVRIQIKSIYAKLGVVRQSELVSHMGHL